MSTVPPTRLPADIGQTAGPLLLGHFLHWGLFGALSVQVYNYYLAFPNDAPRRKFLVYGVYAAELVQTILFAKMAFEEFATGFGSFQALDKSGLIWFAVPILSSTVAFVVQIFYAYRIKLLAESYIIPIVVVLFAFIQLGGGIALGVCAKRIPFFSEFWVTPILISTGIWNIGSAVCDLIIAASMAYYLSRRRTNWKPTQRLILKLTRLIIETGILTATVAIVNLILSLLPINETYYQTTSAILGITYASAMMVVLNSRITFSHHESTSNDLNSRISQRPLQDASNGGISNGAISVTREEWTALDVYNIQVIKGVEANSDNEHGASKV